MHERGSIAAGLDDQPTQDYLKAIATKNEKDFNIASGFLWIAATAMRGLGVLGDLTTSSSAVLDDSIVFRPAPTAGEIGSVNTGSKLERIKGDFREYGVDHIRARLVGSDQEHVEEPKADLKCASRSAS